MPNSPQAPDTSRPQLATLRHLATQAVTTIAGVSRIEPTLTQAIHNLRHTTPVPPDGTVHLSRGTNQLINAEVELSVTSDRTAYDTAQDVRATLTQLLINHGHIPGRVTVTVLHLQDESQTS